MVDLVISTGVLVLLAGAFGGGGWMVARRLGKDALLPAVFAAASGLALFSIYVNDSVWFARVMPYSGVVILSDLRLPLAALIAGLLWRRLDGGVSRRVVLLAALLGLSAWPVVTKLFPRKLDLQDRWRGPVCLQSTNATCSPAAAATLLRWHGVATGEAEMARLCLTTNQGTPMLGLYRGLKIKSKAIGTDVVVVQANITQLRELSSAQPVILSVRLLPADANSKYDQRWGWAPNMGHTVVLFGFEGDRPIVGDPSIGPERWSMQDLAILWHGEAMYIAAKKPDVR